MKDFDKMSPGFSRIQSHLKETTSKKPSSLIKDLRRPRSPEARKSGRQRRQQKNVCWKRQIEQDHVSARCVYVCVLVCRWL